ncbi:hypothetical protein AYK26_00115 [Euryarchaeota archaeon SM23-78]|nr:MAG: hypothetical protein AYK26_00115 [Euryarchaeota archaeon SM23-78]MBW3000518.1 hypothetical protein [Candidatus Woesearchaeota archaeon]
MDFDKFLERDIIEFLDEQAMLVAEKAAGLREEEFDLYEITQDYSKEISEALKEDDLRKAREVFEEVKNKYLKAPESSLSKKRLYIIMEEIYQRIKDYEAKEEGKKSLFETIKEYEEQGLFTKPELFEKKKADNISIILSSITKKEKELEKITNKETIIMEDLKQAIKLYREMKELTRRMPITYPKEKANAYESALSWYYTIRKLKEQFGEKEEKKEAKKGKEEKPVEERLAEIRKLKEKIVESHTKIVEYLKKKELRKSIEEYRNLKNLCEQFPYEMEEEKIALLADALSLYENIKKLKKSLSQTQRREYFEKKEEREEEQARKKEVWDKLTRIRQFIRTKDTSKAIKEYKELQEVFKDYPEHPLEEKKKVYNEILSAHRDIHSLDTDLKRKKVTHYKEEFLDNKANITNIKSILEDIHTLLDRGQTERATQKLLEAKHKIQLLPTEEFDEKYKLMKETKKLENKLLFVKNIKRINNPQIITTY